MFRTSYRVHQDLVSLADTKANIMISVNGLIISIILAAVSPRIGGLPLLVLPTSILLVGRRGVDAIRCRWRNDDEDAPPPRGRRQTLRIAIGRQDHSRVGVGSAGNARRRDPARSAVLVSPIGSSDHSEASRGGRCATSATGACPGAGQPPSRRIPSGVRRNAGALRRTPGRSSGG